MLFYTDVYKRGNFIYFRGYKDGKRVSDKIPFQPTIYVRTGNKDSPYKSLLGEPLDKKVFGSIKESKAFLDHYKDVSNFPIYGNINLAYQFITKVFPDAIQFDMSLMTILTIDIERVANESKAGKDMQDKMQKKQSSLQAKIEEKKKQIAHRRNLKRFKSGLRTDESGNDIVEYQFRTQ